MSSPFDKYVKEIATKKAVSVGETIFKNLKEDVVTDICEQYLIKRGYTVTKPVPVVKPPSLEEEMQRMIASAPLSARGGGTLSDEDKLAIVQRVADEAFNNMFVEQEIPPGAEKIMPAEKLKVVAEAIDTIKNEEFLEILKGIGPLNESTT